MPLSTAQLREEWGPPCKVPLATLTLHSGAKITVNKATIEAFRAVDSVMAAHDYHPPAVDTGAFNCRRITGGTGYSLHAFGIAADYWWSRNPYGRTLVTNMPPLMVRAILAIRTSNGTQVFTWGGDFDGDGRADDRIYDAMHFQVACTRTALAGGIDWSTVQGTPTTVQVGTPKGPDPQDPAKTDGPPIWEEDSMPILTTLRADEVPNGGRHVEGGEAKVYLTFGRADSIHLDGQELADYQFRFPGQVPVPMRAANLDRLVED